MSSIVDKGGLMGTFFLPLLPGAGGEPVLAQDTAGAIDLLALVALDEADLMRTLDPQVRADVAGAARLLARALHGCGVCGMP